MALELSKKTPDPIPVDRASGNDIGTGGPKAILKGAGEDSNTAKAPQRGVGDLFETLPAHEASILRRQVAHPEVKATVGLLYNYTSKNDLSIILLSSICSIAGGAAIPLMAVVFGKLQGLYQDYFLGRTNYEFFMSQMSSMVLYFVYLAVGQFICVYVATIGFVYTGEHITAKIREHYLESCLRQNIGFFDKVGAGEVTTRMTADMNLIQDGISQKLGLTLTAIASFVSAFLIGFVTFWKLTLVLSSAVVALFILTGVGGRLLVKFNKHSVNSYAVGGSIADEAISSIRNAVAFGAQDRLAKQYDQHLAIAEKSSFKAKVTMGVLMASMVSFIPAFIFSL